MNEVEWSNSLSQNKLHRNAKRAYPYWKVCKVCSTVYPCLTREQATRSKTCSKECAAKAVSLAPRKHKEHEPNTTCPVCGKEFYVPMAWKRKAKTNYCSASCRSRDKCGPILTAYNREHPTPMTEERKQKLREQMTGPRNPSWKGGVTYRHSHGNYKGARYVRCPKEFSEMARKDGYVMEHRLVVAQAIGRPLTRQECVHHVNHDPLDNRLENLMLFPSNAAHKTYESRGELSPLWQW